MELVKGKVRMVSHGAEEGRQRTGEAAVETAAEAVEATVGPLRRRLRTVLNKPRSMRTCPRRRTWTIRVAEAAVVAAEGGAAAARTAEGTGWRVELRRPRARCGWVCEASAGNISSIYARLGGPVHKCLCEVHMGWQARHVRHTGEGIVCTE